MARRLCVFFAVLVLVAGAGCTPKEAPPAPTPKVNPPVIGKAGVLRVGVDLSYPPFAGEDKGKQVGIDVDVVSALAERLGLTVELVDLTPSEIPAALTDGEIDVALGAVSISDAVQAGVGFAGSYLADGPAVFSFVETGSADATGAPAFDVALLGQARVACQAESAAYWQLESDYGEGFVKSFPTLREAMDALEAREVDYVVGSAAVGAYLARDFDGVAFASQYGPASPLGVLVAQDAAELETVIRDTLDELASEGVLDAIRTKWLGGLPRLEVDVSAEPSAAKTP